jgi:signal transduction histidine kinase
VRIRTQLALWYSAILLVSFVLISGWAYYEVVIEHPDVARALAREGYTPLDEFVEVMLYGGIPALIIVLAGGWFLMHRALSPVNTLTTAMESIHAETLERQLPRTGNRDELDRLAEVFNSMMTRLDQSFTRVREFTINASHELKTPLTIMRGEIETRLRDSAPSAAEREFLASQLDEIARLAKIVDALTLLAKADTGQLSIAREPVRMDELLRDCFADAQILAQPAHVRVEMKICDEVMVRGDRHRLRQLLLNLADNAIKYNRPDGRVLMSLARDNGTMELTIANTGPGISAEKWGGGRQRIGFEYRAMDRQGSWWSDQALLRAGKVDDGHCAFARFGWRCGFHSGAHLGISPKPHRKELGRRRARSLSD